MDRNHVDIKIVDNGEPLVDLKLACPFAMIDLGDERIRIEKTAYARKSVADMIVKAYHLLPPGYSFIIRDAWRPEQVQEKILRSFYRRFKRKHPDWSDNRIKKEVGIYAAPSEGKYVSGHMTGGALDIRLVKNGRKIPMKSRKLAYQENALSFQDALPHYLQNNRKIMSEALSKAGLTNYPAEFWHWSYGDVWWAKRNGKSQAIYGKIDKVEV